MKYTGGWGAGLMTEFFVTVNGNFEWKKRLQTESSAEQRYEKRTGRLSNDAITSLIREIGQSGPGPIADDAGQVIFRWLNGKGEAHLKNYSVPGLPPAADLLESIETLARRHGQMPKAVP